MREFYTETKPIDGTQDVLYPSFRSSKYREEVKQVWCNPWNDPAQVSTCAVDGDDCMCPTDGLIVYSAAGGFYPSLNNYLTADVVNATNNGHVSCEPSSFEDVDPLPGQDKSCYCVNKRLTLNPNIDPFVQGIKEYWRQVAAEKAAKEEEERKAAEAEALRQQEAERLRLEELEKKKQEAEAAAKLKARLEREAKEKEEAAKRAAEEAARIKAAEEAAIKKQKEEEEAAKKAAAEAARLKAEAEAKKQAMLDAHEAKVRAEAEKEFEKEKKLALEAAVKAALLKKKAEHDEIIAAKKAEKEA